MATDNASCCSLSPATRRTQEVNPYPSHECVDRPELPCPACAATPAAAGTRAGAKAKAEVGTAQKFLSLLGLLFLAVSIPVFAQQNYTMTPSLTFEDSTPYCNSTATYNCWTQLPGNVASVSVGSDGTIYGLDTGGNPYKLKMSTRSVPANWVHSSLPAVRQITVQDAANVYALSSAGGLGGCPAGAYEVLKANAALNGWTVIPGCLQYLSVAYDGTLVGVVSGSAYTQLSGGSWIALPGTGYTSQITVQDKTTAYVLKGTAVYVVNITSRTVSVLSPATTATSIAASPSGFLWYAGNNNAQGNGNIYSLAQGAAAPVAYRGQLSQVFTGVMNLTFAIVNGTHNVYHFRQLVPALTVVESGNYICQGGSCPQGSMHTGTAVAKWQTGGLNNGLGVSSNSAAVLPATALTASAKDFALGCDSWFGDHTSTNCQVDSNASSGSVKCAIMGQIVKQMVLGLLFDQHYEAALTWVEATGPKFGCHGAGLGIDCFWPVKPNCTLLTTPPDMKPKTVHDWDTSAQDWEGWGMCWTFKLSLQGGYIGWQCSDKIDLGWGIRYFVPQPPRECTKVDPNL